MSRRRLRDLITSGLEVAGAASITFGVNYLLGLGAALVTAGVFGIVAGYLLGDPE